METKESDSQLSVELFEGLKGKCKSSVKRDLYIWLACCIILIPLFFTGIKLDDYKGIKFFIFLIVILCMGGWFSLFNIRLLKQFDNFDTPERLLYCFEKRHRFDLILWLVSCIGIIGIYFLTYGLSFWSYLSAAIFIVVFAFIYYSGGPLMYRKDSDIIEQLHELVDKK